MKQVACKNCGNELLYKRGVNFIVFCSKCLKEGYMECEGGYGPVTPCLVYFGINPIGIIAVIEKQKYVLKLDEKKEIVLKETYLNALYEAITVIENYIKNNQ